MNLGPRRAIIDVGANVGAASAALLLIYQPKHSIALEPHPELLPALTEVTFQPIYAVGALFHEVRAHLRYRGFSLRRLEQFSGLRSATYQADALYLRA